jgi:hypothetical protein
VLPGSKKESQDLTKERKGKAILKLVFTVLLMDAIAIALYLILVIGFGWDQMIPTVLLIMISVLSGFYYQWKKKNIEA